MKLIPIFFLAITIAVGIYLQGKSSETSTDAMVEDSVESKMAAPIKSDIPL
jgi:hypothetical protein